MLKGIPRILPPDLLKVLMEMGHGDELVISDANFPAASNACRLVRCDGSDVVEVLKAVMQFFPLDTFLPCPAALMAVVPGDYMNRKSGRNSASKSSATKRGFKSLRWWSA